MRIKEMNTNSRSSGLLTNSPRKHHRKCVEDSLENNTYQFRRLTENKTPLLRQRKRQFLRYCQWLHLVCYFRQNQRIFLMSKHWPVFPYKFLYLCSKHTLHLSIRISNIQSFSLCKFFSADTIITALYWNQTWILCTSYSLALKFWNTFISVLPTD